VSVLDLGPVRYEPPLTRSSPWGPQPKALTTGPRFVRGRTRWHRVRSGTLHPHGEAWAMWCGQTRFGNDKPDTTDELPADGLPLCGGVELRFDPNRLTPPRWCPGGKLRRLHEQLAYRVLRCGACGEIVPERNAHRWYDTAGMPRQHEPGPGLVPGCPLHAWRHLVRTAEGVACACAGIEEQSH